MSMPTSKFKKTFCKFLICFIASSRLERIKYISDFLPKKRKIDVNSIHGKYSNPMIKVL